MIRAQIVTVCSIALVVIGGLALVVVPSSQKIDTPVLTLVPQMAAQHELVQKRLAASENVPSDPTRSGLSAASINPFATSSARKIARQGLALPAILKSSETIAAASKINILVPKQPVDKLQAAAVEPQVASASASQAAQPQLPARQLDLRQAPATEVPPPFQARRAQVASSTQALVESSATIRIPRRPTS